jgi:hypothetical protein
VRRGLREEEEDVAEQEHQMRSGSWDRHVEPAHKSVAAVVVQCGNARARWPS